MASSLKVNNIFLIVQQIAALCLLSTTILTNAYEIKAFSSFLQANHLKHAIVVMQNSTTWNKETKKDLENLIGNYRIRFVNVNALGKVENFSSNFYINSPRSGIFIPQIANELAQQQLLATTAAAGDIFNNTQAWFIVAGKPSIELWTNVKRIFANFNININADITLALKYTNNCLKLYDLYKICHLCGAPLEIEDKGIWSTAFGYQVHAKFLESFVARRRNFRNVTLKVGTAILEKPANLTGIAYLMNMHDNMQLDTMQRKTYNLMKMLEPLFNLSTEIIFSDGWNGVIADVISHEIEYSICPIRFTLTRLHAVQFSPELHTEYILFLLRHPRRKIIRNIFFEPFTDFVWWSVLFVIVAAILLLSVHVYHEYNQEKAKARAQTATKLHKRKQCNPLKYQFEKQHQHQQEQEQERHEEQKLNAAPTTTIEPHFDFIALTILEAIFMQGPSPNTFNFISTRILIMSTCIFSFMLLQFYSGFIVGSLLADVPRTITTLSALYNSSLAIGMENISYNYEIFNTTNQIARAIYAERICKISTAASMILPKQQQQQKQQKHEQRNNIFTIEQGAERIGRGGFAFHVSADRMYRILKYLLNEPEFCDLQEINLNPPYTSSVVSRKSSPYREHLAHAILHFRATGLLQYNDKIWKINKPDCALNQNREVDVDIEHFIPALVFLTAAMVICVFVFLVEFIINWWQCRK